jgi:signal transduction histidine kinase
MRPLDRLWSIKAKLAVVIVFATVIGVGMGVAGGSLGLENPFGTIIGVIFALVLGQALARGMTSPLREMVQATRAMASGDYSKRVRATSRDEVGQLAHAFNAMAAELAETDRVRRDLVANVSHELRTPISGLQAALENIIDGASQPNDDTLRIMLAQTERLGRLVSELLDLSRLESGVIELRPETVPLHSLLEECVEEVALAWPNVAVQTLVEPPDLTLRVDPGRWRQVVINLVMNAARVSPTGSLVAVKVKLDHQTVQMDVCDSGPGIPPEDRKRVFERFYRADAARSPDGGAGLGLAIVKWIVDLHGGSIAAEGNEPRGCRMVVKVPRAGAVVQKAPRSQ